MTEVNQNSNKPKETGEKIHDKIHETGNDEKNHVKDGADYIKNVLIASIIVIAVSIYPVTVYASKIQIYSFITGYLISLLNAMIGYGMNEMAFKKPVKSFMVIVFGGMGLRIILVGLFLLITLEFTDLNAVSLVSSVFIFYVLFVSLEIHYLHKKQAAGIKTASAENIK